MRSKHLSALVAAVVVAAMCAAAAVENARPRRALWTDNDARSIPEPARHPDSLNYEFLHATFGYAPKNAVHIGKRRAAMNVNAWDEVPDSTWYTNRNHLRPMTLEEIRDGANRGVAPNLSGRLTILEGKTAGTSPGFGRTRDASGRAYFLKFDGAEYPELSTAAEVIASRLFYAMGYFTPEEWIVNIAADQLVPAPDAALWDESGRRRPLTSADISEVLAKSARLPDGRYRAVASLALPGKVKGGFRFYGLRDDDANDLIPHEHRRELRGLRLLCAWLNHFDVRVGNTMDLYVEEQGRRFLRHYLLDFGSTLGSASYFPKSPRMGFSYVLDARETSGPLFTLGVYQPRWREHPAPVKYPSVGRFESAMFQPALWKPVLPVAAFDNMDAADALWSARIVMSFTEEQIRAAVHEGKYTDPRAEEEVVQHLLERRQKIAYYAMTKANPLDRFRLAQDGGRQRLEFVDLAVRYGVAESAGRTYAYGLYGAGKKQLASAKNATPEPRIELGELHRIARSSGLSSTLFVLELRVNGGSGEAAGPVRVFLESEPDAFVLRGWSRD